jgi:hypothetical protein
MTLTTATHTLVLKRQSGRYKFKLLVGKFTCGNKAKYYWVILTNSLFSKICWQCPAMFAFTPQTNFPAHYLKKISLKVKVIGSNPGYLLRSFLLTKINIFLFLFQLKHRVSLPITVSSTTDGGALRPTAHQTAQQKPGVDLKHFAPA